MVTGVQNSQNMVTQGAGASAPTQQSQSALQPAQQLPQNPNLSQMEKNQNAMRDAKTVSATVYHGVPGSSYFAKGGTRFEFDYKGEMSVDNEEVQKDLDAIADKPGSPVFAKNSRPTPAPGDDLPVKDIQARAAQVVADLKKEAKV